MNGELYIVATPIGNLGDITLRAIDTLKAVELILAEDTRHSARLLNHLGIRKPMKSLHSHNEHAQTEGILEKLAAGARIALISDAGTPLISDPGYPLVREARQAGIPVTPVPGPSAIVAALSISGLPCDRFAFEGFLPARAAARRKQLETLRNETRTLVFYESPHRIQHCIADLSDIFGAARNGVIARELTKTYEQVHQDTLAGLEAWLAAAEDHRRGEMVILVEGVEAAPPKSAVDTDKVLQTLLTHLPVKQAARITAEITGEPRNQLYQQALEIRQKK